MSIGHPMRPGTTRASNAGPRTHACPGRDAARGPGPGRPDDDGLQVAPLLEGVEPGYVAVFERASHRLKQLQPRVLLPPDAFQVYFE